LSSAFPPRAAATVALLGLLALNPAATVLLTQPPAHAQPALAAARAAQTITVRLEGATQGSGVLVKREGNRYTVLTAWHVVSGQRPCEELAIITPDGSQHQLEQGSIQRLGQVDLAVLSFSSPASYAVAQLGEIRNVAMGNPIYVAGLPLASSAVPTRLLRFLDGRVVANATVAIANGYQLLYSAQQPTLPGTSGGPLLNSQGQLVGIHAVRVKPKTGRRSRKGST
jgi:S1-C subfamily serine protease